MPIDLQAIKNLQATFEDAGQASFTRILTGNIGGHAVEVDPAQQLGVNMEFSQSLLTEIFGGDLRGLPAMDSNRVNFLKADSLLGKRLAVSDHPLTGHEIAVAIGDVADLLSRSETAREKVVDFLNGKFAQANLPEAGEADRFDIDQAVLNVQDVLNDPSACTEKLDGMANKMIKACRNLDACSEFSPSVRDILKHSSMGSPLFAKPAVYEALRHILGNVDFSGLKEMLANPDEFTAGQKVRILSTLIASFEADEAYKKTNPESGDLMQLTTLVLAAKVSADPEFAAGLAALSNELPQVLDEAVKLSSDVRINYKNVADGPEVNYADHGIQIIQVINHLNQEIQKANAALKAEILTPLKASSGLPDSFLNALNLSRLDTYLSKNADRSERKKRLDMFVADVQEGVKQLRESHALSRVSKAWCLKQMMLMPDLYESGAMFVVPNAAISEMDLDGIEDTLAGPTLYEPPQRFAALAEFANQLNDKVLKGFQSAQYPIEMTAESVGIAKKMAVMMLAARRPAFAGLVRDPDRELARMGAMLDGVYKDSDFYAGAREAIDLLLSLKRAMA